MMVRLSAQKLKLTTRRMFPVIASGSPGTPTGNFVKYHEPMPSEPWNCLIRTDNGGTDYVGQFEVSRRIKIGNSRPKLHSIATSMLAKVPGSQV